MTSTGSGTCQTTRKDGRPCQAWALTGSSFCWAHDPTLAAERRAARSLGGRVRHGRTVATTTGAVQLGSVADVVGVLQRTLVDLFRLENSISRARAVAYCASVAVRALEVSELEQRVQRLELLLLDGVQLTEGTEGGEL